MLWTLPLVGEDDDDVDVTLVEGETTAADVSSLEYRAEGDDCTDAMDVTTVAVVVTGEWGLRSIVVNLSLEFLCRKRCNEDAIVWTATGDGIKMRCLGMAVP